MKYILSESKFDKVIFKYLDNQDFVPVERGSRIYFVNSEGDTEALIVLDKDTRMIVISDALIDELIEFFSNRKNYLSKSVVSWVMEKLGVDNYRHIVTHYRIGFYKD
jgi:hypothetical protein